MTVRTFVAAGVALTLLVAAPMPVASADVSGAVRFTLPVPTGRHPLSTTSLHLVDETRQDPWKPDRKRELMVTVTFPAREVSSFPRAEWVSPGVAPVVEELAALPDYLNIPKGSVDWGRARRHAYAGAPADRSGGGRPVVFFSPGLGMPRELDSVLTDDLASCGYLVVSMSHTYESAFVEFPGGRVERALDLGGDPETLKTAIDVRVGDTRFVLDQLALLEAGGNPDAEGRPLPPGLAGALDLSDIGMFGHSYGGFTAGESMFHDRRIDAGANLDGAMAYGFGESYLPGEVAKHGLDRPFLLMGAASWNPATGERLVHNHLPGNFDQSWVDFWPRQRGWKRDLTLFEGGHHSYSDFQAVLPQLGSLVAPEIRETFIGTVDPGRSLAAQQAYLGAFFALHLRGRDGHLFDGPSPRYPEFTFVW